MNRRDVLLGVVAAPLAAAVPAEMDVGTRFAKAAAEAAAAKHHLDNARRYITVNIRSTPMTRETAIEIGKQLSRAIDRQP